MNISPVNMQPSFGKAEIRLVGKSVSKTLEDTVKSHKSMIEGYAELQELPVVMIAQKNEKAFLVNSGSITSVHPIDTSKKIYNNIVKNIIANGSAKRGSLEEGLSTLA